jgi:hypothetical protein
LAEREVLLEVGEVVGPGCEGDLVGRPGERADDEFLLGKRRVEHGRHVTEQGRPLEQRIADEADMVAAAEFERQRRRDRFAGRRPRRRLPVDRIAREVFLRGAGRQKGREHHRRHHGQARHVHQEVPGVR